MDLKFRRLLSVDGFLNGPTCPTVQSRGAEGARGRVQESARSPRPRRRPLLILTRDIIPYKALQVYAHIKSPRGWPSRLAALLLARVRSSIVGAPVFLALLVEGEEEGVCGVFRATCHFDERVQFLDRNVELHVTHGLHRGASGEHE